MTGFKCFIVKSSAQPWESLKKKYLFSMQAEYNENIKNPHTF